MREKEADLNILRGEINKIDDELIKLIVMRQETAKLIGLAKKEQGLEVFNPAREQEVINRLLEKTPDEYKDAVKKLYGTIFEISKAVQEEKA